MPLAHKLSSMIFIMPNHVEPLERVEKLLNKEQLKTWTSKMKKRSVAISLPKVVLEVSHDLQVKEVLEQLDLADLWDGRNSGMVGYPCLLPLSLGTVSSLGGSLTSCLLLETLGWPGPDRSH